MKEANKLQIRFYKHILGVRQQTPNIAVYGELGKYPLSVLAKIRSLNYWLKIRIDATSLLHSTYLDQRIDLRLNSWSSKIKECLESLGLNYMWQNLDDNVHYRPIINQRILDQYIQSWNAAVRITSKLGHYEKIKTTFEYEPYLDI